MEEDNKVNPFLPAGFRFHPTDEELIVHYLKKKVTSSSNSVASMIAEINLYNFNPWELPDKASFGDNEWFLYTPRDRKYPNGVRPNRATASGYWKATGCDKPILSSKGLQCIGLKKALVFYRGRPPTGSKTSWMMYEYRLPSHSFQSLRLRGSMRLDDWVLCHIRHKSMTKGNRKGSKASTPSIDEKHVITDDINYLKDHELVINPQENVVTDEFGCLHSLVENNTCLDSDGNTKNQMEMAAGSVKETLASIKKILSLGNLDEQMQSLPDESVYNIFK